MKKHRLLLIVLLGLIILIQPVAFVNAAPPQDTPGNGPPIPEKTVFVHYPKDVAPGKPTGTPGGKPDKNNSKDLYSYNKTHWPYEDAAVGIPWKYNTTGAPGAFFDAIQASFDTWDGVQTASIDFRFDGPSFAIPGDYDGTNVVGWGDISSEYPGAIGVTTVWSYRYIKGERIIVDCDTILNTGAPFAWTSGGFTGDTALFDVDVQNIMTHEAGHWLMLLDLYDDYAIEQTMYGYAGELETKKTDLAEGDMAGISVIYR